MPRVRQHATSAAGCSTTRSVQQNRRETRSLLIGRTNAQLRGTTTVSLYCFCSKTQDTPEDECCQRLDPIKWTHQAQGNSSAASAGSVFVVTEQGTVEKVAQLTGQPSWVVTLPGAPAIVATPTAPYGGLAGGEVLVGASDGALYCLDAGDGRVKWRFQASAQSQRNRGGRDSVS